MENGSDDYRPKSAKPKPTEQPKLQQEKPAGNPSRENVRPPNIPPAVFDCVTPKITIPPVHLRFMLRNGMIKEQYAQEAEQEWREDVKTWERQWLEDEIRSLEEEHDDASNSNKQEDVQDIEYQLKILREELLQRKAD